MEIIFLFETNYDVLHDILNEIQLHNSRHITVKGLNPVPVG